MKKKYLNFLFCTISFLSFSQTQVFKEAGKWGIKENGQVLIKPVHDTVFNFDSTGKVCLACTKIRSAHANKYIKSPVLSFNCSYINKKGERLIIKQTGADTTSIFSLHKTTLSNYIGTKNIMTVEVGNKKHLVDKDFKQYTSKGYDDIHFSGDPLFLIAEKKTEGHSTFAGLLNLKEEEVIPYKYSHIKINNKDSLIIGCTAGQGANSEDDIFDYTGKKISSYHRHIELATKKYIVHKIFVPKEYLIVLNLETKEEQTEHAEVAIYHTDDSILMMNEGHWFTYDVKTHKKKPYDLKHKK